MGERETARVLLGEISRAHGVRGEVIVRSFCDPPEDIASFGPLSDERGGRTFTIKLRGTTAKGLIAVIDGISDRNAAEALRGTGLYIDRDRLPEPDDDEFYHEDLVGLSVERADGTPLGTVVAVQNFGAGDLIEVRTEGAKKTEFYPFDAQFIPEVDLDRGVIVVAIDEPDEDDGPAPPPG
jgi:16S rRNA processing protein RimM